MKRKLAVLVFSTVTFLAIGQQGVFKDLSVSEFKSMLDSMSGEILIDVRTPDEMKKGIIPNAIGLDYFNRDFEAEISKLEKNKTYFVYCAEGGRSSETMEFMSKKGFKQAYNLKEGFNTWKKRKMVVEKPK